jgi:hypothetical protein
MTQLTLDGISTVCTGGKLKGENDPVMPTSSPPATLADLSEQPLRFHSSLTLRLDAESLRAVENLAARLGSTKGTVARRLLHLGVFSHQVLLEDANAAPQG